MRVFATADLHADFHANRELVEGLPRSEHRDDLLLVAGDIAHRADLAIEVVGGLRARFARVFFVPGNHDLWVRGEEGDSVAKFQDLLARCAQVGVETGPAVVGDLLVVPLFSWYEPALDGGGQVPARWADRRHCRWPAAVSEPAAYFASLNEPACRAIAAGDCPPGQGQACLTLTCSHFVPRRDLLPPAVFLRYADLPKVAGSPRIERQLREVGADIHVFGHSHICVDQTIGGVRYVQHSLGYPRERRQPRPVLKQVL